MPKEMNEEEMNKVLFANLMTMLATTAFQALGKMINPQTGKPEINLEAAQLWIDMLSMLHAKTKGNLTQEEEKYLTDSISALQMNFVETAKSNPPAENKPEQEKTPAETAAPATAPETSSTESKEPKFRKSYGEQ